MGAATKAYLVAYNAAQTWGWLACLLLLARSIAQGKSPEAIYHDVAPVLGFWQGVALLEALHAALGLVRSSPLMCLLQWVGRCHVLFMVLHQVVQVQSSWFGPVMIAVWGLADVIRYPWYALTSLDSCPPWLTWLRYSAFVPLYPVGVAAEMGLLYLALPVVQGDGRWSLRLPNAFNYGFEYSVFIQVGLAVYPFLWWFVLYSPLLRQRTKKLQQGAGKQGKSE